MDAEDKSPRVADSSIQQPTTQTVVDSERTPAGTMHRIVSDIEKEAMTEDEISVREADSSVVEPKDPNVIGWDGPDDPENPLNWTAKKKWSYIAVLATVSLTTPLGSTIFAPAVPELMDDFHSSNQLLSGFVVSVYILGFVFGPLLSAPLSEMYGRAPVIHISNIIFFIFTIACAVSSNLAMFTVFRFIVGSAGATPITIGAGIIADMKAPEERGAAMAIWAMGPLIGPVLGPIIGGFMAETVGWRWIFWLMAMLSGVATFICFFTVRETYHETILRHRTARLQKETGNMELRSALSRQETRGQLLRRSIVRPVKMLFCFPIVFILGLNMAILYGYLYLLFTTVTYVFMGQYHFNSGEAGLSYLGIGLGMFGGLIAFGATSDRIMTKMKNKNGGNFKPEYRLPGLIIASFFIPVGLFWYGWSTKANAPWIVPILGQFMFGIGTVGTFMPIQTYLVDAYPIYAASASAAVAVLRSLFGAVLPLAGQKMYATLGLGWGNSLLGFIAIALLPIPFLLLKYGERIRTSKRWQLDL